MHQVMPVNPAPHKKTNNLMDLEMILNLKTMSNQLKTNRLACQRKLQSPTNLKKPVRPTDRRNLTNQLRQSRSTNRRKLRGRTNQGANLEKQMKVVKAKNLEKVVKAMNRPSLEKPRSQREMKFQETTTKV